MDLTHLVVSSVKLFKLSCIFFLSSSLFASTQLTMCQQKVVDSQSLQDDAVSLAISKTTRLLYTKKLSSEHILKYDPFLSLYLIETNNSFAYPFRFAKEYSKTLFVVGTKLEKKVTVVKRQIGLNHLAELSSNVNGASLLLTKCCSVEAIGKDGLYIEKVYLEHFLHSNKLFYGDIGIRVIEGENGVEVASVNPFRRRLFMHGDKIVAINNKDISNAADCMQTILFAKRGERLNVEIIRKNKHLVLTPLVKERLGGGCLSDTFLETEGIYVDDSLHIIRLKKNKFFLKTGDKILQVNLKKVTTQQQLRQELSNAKKSLSLLVLRDGFEFFVKII